MKGLSKGSGRIDKGSIAPEFNERVEGFLSGGGGVCGGFGLNAT